MLFYIIIFSQGPVTVFVNNSTHFTILHKKKQFSLFSDILIFFVPVQRIPYLKTLEGKTSCHPHRKKPTVHNNDPYGRRRYFLVSCH
jgi:hypothetical protein